MRKNGQTREVLLLIGSNIAFTRKAKGWTQEEFGKLLNLSRPSIINIESGKHACTLETIITVCKLFECEVWDIVPSLNDGALLKRLRKFRKEKKESADAKKREKIKVLQEQINKIKKG